MAMRGMEEEGGGAKVGFSWEIQTIEEGGGGGG